MSSRLCSPPRRRGCVCTTSRPVKERSIKGVRARPACDSLHTAFAQAWGGGATHDPDPGADVDALRTAWICHPRRAHARCACPTRRQTPSPISPHLHTHRGAARSASRLRHCQIGGPRGSCWVLLAGRGVAASLLRFELRASRFARRRAEIHRGRMRSDEIATVIALSTRRPCTRSAGGVRRRHASQARYVRRLQPATSDTRGQLASYRF